MKVFKQADFYGQLLLLVGFTFASITSGFGIMMIGYFVVGAWQVISMVIHFYNEWHMHKGGRRNNYFYISIVAIVLLAATFLFPKALFPVMFLMLFLTPLMVDTILSFVFTKFSIHTGDHLKPSFKTNNDVEQNNNCRRLRFYWPTPGAMVC